MAMLVDLVQHFWPALGQGQVFRRMVALLVGEVLTLGRYPEM